MLETNSLHPTKVQIVPFTGNKKLSLLIQRSPTFLSPGTGFMEDSFSMDPGGWGCFGDDLRALHVLCTLFLLLLHKLHLRSSGIRSQRLGTPALIPSLDQYSGLMSFRIDWFDLLGDSQESSSIPQFKDINSLALSFLYGPTVISIHDYWKNSSFECTDLCW